MEVKIPNPPRRGGIATDSPAFFAGEKASAKKIAQKFRLF